MLEVDATGVAESHIHVASRPIRGDVIGRKMDLGPQSKFALQYLEVVIEVLLEPDEEDVP